MANSWIQALKEYNKGGAWCVYKSGTPEYNEVRKIQQRMTGKKVQIIERKIKEDDKKVQIIERKIKEEEKKLDGYMKSTSNAPMVFNARSSTVERIDDLKSKLAQAKKGKTTATSKEFKKKMKEGKLTKDDIKNEVKSTFRVIDDNEYAIAESLMKAIDAKAEELHKMNIPPKPANVESKFNVYKLKELIDIETQSLSSMKSGKQKDELKDDIKTYKDRLNQMPKYTKKELEEAMKYESAKGSPKIRTEAKKYMLSPIKSEYQMLGAKLIKGQGVILTLK